LYNGILVKSFNETDSLKNFLRITVGKKEENNKMLTLLKEFL